MTTQREMTLDEFLERELPEFHLARQQLGELRAKLAAAEQRAEEMAADNRHLRSVIRSMSQVTNLGAVIEMANMALRENPSDTMTALERELGEAQRDRDDWHKAAAGMSADLTAIGQQHDALATFVNEAINACFDGCGIDGAWIQERGEELGLLEAVAYDPEIHHIDAYVPEPGETIYVRAAWLGTVTQGDDS